MIRNLSTLFSILLLSSLAHAEESVWKAGVASVAITPDESMWMAGYASRDKPSEGKIHDLYAKALAIEDRAGTRLVVVTTDLIGIPRELRDWLEKEVQRSFKLSPASLMLNASHTHCGPELRVSKASVYGLEPERVRQSQAYVEELKRKLAGVIGQAIESMSPARLGYTHGRAGFAMNRRLPTDTEPRNAPYPDGPVDHDVPVLRVESPEGILRAVVFGYACHNTTLGFQQFCGDYAGFAQHYLEEAHPNVKAMFVTGCGADQNPQPRRTLELAEQHGRALANGVEAALIGPTKPIDGQLRVTIDEVTLEFAEPPGRAALELQAQSSNKYEQRHAEALLRQLEETGEIRQTYPYLVQVINFGDDLLMIALAGEVVVDYSHRFKLELRGAPVWVAGYSNDVFGYVPSLRVLQEGGYEGGGAMRYTTLPGPFAPTVERLIVDKVHQLVSEVRAIANQ
ncbi:MAG: neutral/alkaline non-lysosomal ceramidase N-terminal domain-containing protein [Planctomycetaceae bacterium]|nr:neutral/alkaline non-lysosomal ceramidase N-terminal domain-containing protein [Planctomycetales bacterium]MCB9922055.1 neutral/alkaline non-lysosomal ceramidase N-terminal domain-containing protein [Planctomycetaceae bacterium]